jgi:hypothetical protein
MVDLVDPSPRKQVPFAFGSCKRCLRRFVTTWVIALSAAASGVSCFQAQPSVAGCAGSGEAAISLPGQWIPSVGTARITADPIKVRPCHTVEWQYILKSQPVFIANQQVGGVFTGAQGVSLWIRSDRNGLVFLRLRLSDSTNHVVSFAASSQWSQVEFRFSEFLPERPGTKLDPGKITSILFADLNGQTGALTGGRTLWISDVTKLVGSPSRRTAPQVQPSNIAGQWLASLGTVRMAADAIGVRPNPVLEWRYHIPREPVFVANQTIVDLLSRSTGVSFWIRSDRPGILFTRLGLSDGSTWVASFDATQKWRRISFRYDQFLPEKPAGRLDSSKIRSILFADLSGEKAALTGERTVWVADVQGMP